MERTSHRPEDLVSINKKTKSTLPISSLTKQDRIPSFTRRRRRHLQRLSQPNLFYESTSPATVLNNEKDILPSELPVKKFEPSHLE